MLGQPQYAARSTPRSVRRVRVQTFRSRATASPSASGIVDVAAFFVESFACELAKTRGHHRVASFVSDAVGEFGAVGNLLVH